MKSGLFRRIFILSGAVLLLAVTVTEVYVTSEVRTNTIAVLRDNLATQAALMAPDIPFAAADPLDALCRSLKGTTGARVTVIAASGRVLGDSDHDSGGMENHRDRIELQQAQLAGTGMDVRRSGTLEQDFLYVARRIDRNDRTAGFVRLSIPLASVTAAVNRLRLRILLLVIVMLLSTGAFSLWQFDRLRRLTVRIRDFSSALARGGFGSLFIGHAGEFDEIANSLNAMSAELKRSIAASDEEKHRLQVILQSIPDALFILDSGGAIMLSSVAARKAFGESALPGRPFIEVMRNSDFLSLFESVQRSRRAERADVRMDSPFERHFIVHISPLSYREQEASGFVAVFHDITQLKRLEQMRKDFVANISHEIKTPITAIRGFAETLQDGAIDDRAHAGRFLETIRSNSERINNLVDDLMTISKIELGATRLEKRVLDIALVLDQVAATLGSKAAEKGLRLTVAVAPEQQAVSADRDRLLQIVTNLADNAIKFTDQGSVTIGTAVESGTHLLFVRDTGIGIAPKHLPRLGERFYRVDPGRSRTMGGTGLGLAIVKHLVRAHGWEMRIESMPGKGTTVNVVMTEGGAS